MLNNLNNLCVCDIYHHIVQDLLPWCIIHLTTPFSDYCVMFMLFFGDPVTTGKSSTLSIKTYPLKTLTMLISLSFMATVIIWNLLHGQISIITQVQQIQQQWAIMLSSFFQSL